MSNVLVMAFITVPMTLLILHVGNVPEENRTLVIWLIVLVGWMGNWAGVYRADRKWRSIIDAVSAKYRSTNSVKVQR